MEQGRGPTLVERVAKLEAVVLNRGEPMQDEGDLLVVSNGDKTRIYRGGADTQSSSSFEEIMSRIQRGTEHISQAASRIETIGDHIFGVRPEGAEGNDEKQWEPGGTFEHCVRALDRLDESLIRLQRAVTRIEGV